MRNPGAEDARTPTKAEVDAFNSRSPDSVIFMHIVCDHCGHAEAFVSPKTARELIAAGWRITPSFPIYETKCPNC